MCAQAPGCVSSTAQAGAGPGQEVQPELFQLFSIFFFYFLAVLGLCCTGFSLAAAIGATLRLQGASRCDGPSACGAWALGGSGSVVVAPGLQAQAQ